MNQDSAAQFVRAYPPAQPAPGPALWLPFRNGELLTQNLDAPRLHQGDQGSVAMLGLSDPLYLGTLGGMPCLAAEADPNAPIPEEWAAVSLRALFGQVGEAEYGLAGYASQMLHWRRTSLFCPVSGNRTEPREGDWGRRCPECGHISYPHISPATLILIYDGPRLLLAQKPGWGTRYSILAGFVEPNESLEDCVRRETREESGLEITDLAYAGSQPWPYPHQLMVGFTARYVSGEIVIDGEELERAAWFDVSALPDLPPPVSLSRQMIDAWAAKQALQGRDLSAL